MKLRFKNILVVQNTGSISNRALKLAFELAREKQGKVTVVDFVKQPTWLWSEVFGKQQTERLESQKRAVLQKQFDELAISSDVASIQILQGRPITQIVKASVSNNHDLVIKDAFAESSDFFLGSLDMRLMRYCPCPVLLTRPDRKHPIRTLLAAVDPEANPSKKHLNNEIIRQATAFAKLRAAELHLVAVWNMPGFNFDNTDQNLEEWNARKSKAERMARNNMNAIIDCGLSKVKPENIHFCNGDAYQCILDTVDEVKPDLLILGSQSRLGIPGLLMGNTSEKVLRHVDCEVLTMKPNGFASPIAT